MLISKLAPKCNLLKSKLPVLCTCLISASILPNIYIWMLTVSLFHVPEASWCHISSQARLASHFLCDTYTEHFWYTNCFTSAVCFSSEGRWAPILSAWSTNLLSDSLRNLRFLQIETFQVFPVCALFMATLFFDSENCMWNPSSIALHRVSKFTCWVKMDKMHLPSLYSMHLIIN